MHKFFQDKHSYGLLVKHQHDFDYLHDFVVDNEQVNKYVLDFFQYFDSRRLKNPKINPQKSRIPYALRWILIQKIDEAAVLTR